MSNFVKLISGQNNNTIMAGSLTITDTTPSVNTSTGALVVAGGAGVAGSLYATNIFLGGIQVPTNVTMTTAISSATSPLALAISGMPTLTGSNTLTGLLTANGGLIVTGTITVPANSIPSTAISDLTTAINNVVGSSYPTLTGSNTLTGLLTANGGLTVSGTIILPDNSIPSTAISGLTTAINNAIGSTYSTVSATNAAINTATSYGFTSVSTTPIAGFTSTSITLTGQANSYQNGTYNTTYSSILNSNYINPFVGYASTTASTQGWASVDLMYSTTAGTIGQYIGTTSTTVSGTAIKGEWVQLQLPYSGQMDKYSILPALYNNYAPECPIKWTICGSNDNTIWTLVDSQDLTSTNPNIWVNNGANTIPTVFNVATPAGPFSYFRYIAQTKNNTSRTKWTYIYQFNPHLLVSAFTAYTGTNIFSNPIGFSYTTVPSFASNQIGYKLFCMQSPSTAMASVNTVITGISANNWVNISNALTATATGSYTLGSEGTTQGIAINANEGTLLDVAGCTHLAYTSTTGGTLINITPIEW